ncbi:MAG: hypothetical protein WCO58_02320 [bacterium]
MKKQRLILFGTVLLLVIITVYLLHSNSISKSTQPNNLAAAAVGSCPYGCSPSNFTETVKAVSQNSVILSTSFANQNYSNFPNTPTSIYFSYDKVNNPQSTNGFGYNQYVNKTKNTDYLGSNITATAVLNGLEPDTTYYWGYNALIKINKSIYLTFPNSFEFTTLAPQADTLNANKIGKTFATINGTVSTSMQTLQFKYGTSSGSLTKMAVATGFTPLVASPVSAMIIGLTPNTTYYYQLVGTWTGAAGTKTAAGQILSFKTLP